MPTQSIDASYMTARRVTDHWEFVNGSLSPDALVLPNNYTLADHKAAIATFETVCSILIGRKNAIEIGAGQRDLFKKQLREWPTAFRMAVLYRLPDSEFTDRCPRAPNVTDAESRFMAPLDEMLTLWAAANAITPIVLPQNLTRALAVTQVAELRTLYRQIADDEANLSLARGARDRNVDDLRRRSMQYRLAVTATLGKTSSLTLSLPKLRPTFYRKKRVATVPAPDTPDSPDDTPPAP